MLTLLPNYLLLEIQVEFRAPVLEALRSHSCWGGMPDDTYSDLLGVMLYLQSRLENMSVALRIGFSKSDKSQRRVNVIIFGSLLVGPLIHGILSLEKLLQLCCAVLRAVIFSP